MSEEFDKQIKEALSNVQLPYNPAGWDDMANRLDAIDDELDQTIIDGLRTVNPSYSPQRWNHLSEWMDYAWYAKNKYFISKSAEAVLILLALFTFFNYQHHKSQPITSPMPIAAVAPTSADKAKYSTERLQSKEPSTSSEKSYQSTDERTNTETSTDETSKAKQSLAEAQTIDTATDKVRRSPSSNKTQVADSAPNANKSLGSPNAPAAARKKTLENTSNSTVAPPPVPFRLNQSPIQSKEENKAAMPFLPNATDLQKTTDRPIAMSSQRDLLEEFAPLTLRKSAVPFAQLTSLKPLDRKRQAFDNAPIIRSKRKNYRPWSLSTFTDLSFNSIRTPYDNLYDKSGYNQSRVGIGGGIQVHRKLGPVEVSTGAIYSSKQYNPKAFIELFKKNDASEGTHFIFDGIRLNIVSIPVHAAYQINNSEKWRTYFVAGGAFHMALQAEYERAYVTVKEDQIQGIALLVEHQNGTVTEGQTPNFEKKKFPDGLLGDGSMKDNFYFSIDIGLGIERKLSDATSLFVQPTVYYNLFNKGLSANDDIINTFSMQLGMKTRL